MQQARELAADGQPQTGAAVLARRRPIRLLEGLENDLLLVAGNTDAAVGDGEGQHFLRAIELIVVAAPARSGRLDAERDLAAMGKLKGVGEQVLDDLLQPLRVRGP